ncbi:rhomboid family intramembrane serine protease [Natrialbaceae archaeon A-gly3]
MSQSSASPILETLAVFVLVAIVQVMAGLVDAVAGLFVLSTPLTQNPWTILTSVYAHGNLSHLLSNSLALVVFGWPIARATTRLRFHVFFVITGALAGISQVWLGGVLGASVGVLGASGAVFALLGYLLASNPLAEGLSTAIEVPTWLVALVFFALAGIVTLATASPRAALIAHFTGFLFGLVAGRARLLRVSSRYAVNDPAV